MTLNHLGPAGFSDARILIVDDEPLNIRLLSRVLGSAGYTSVRGTEDPTEVVELYASYAPDIILLDLHMPVLSGFDVLGLLDALVPPGEYLPILMLTGDDRAAARDQAFAAGAMDFIGKPFDLAEVLLRIRNLLQTRVMYLELRSRNEALDLSVQERTRELELARLDILDRLAAAAEYRDDATGQHTRRVGRNAGMLAKQLGVPHAEAGVIERAGMLHDVGKIGIPDAILLKPGALSADEFEVMKTHTTIGRRLLAGSPGRTMQTAEEIALLHHERWDGGGYHGIAGDSIPLAARVVCIVDVFDALTNDRPYRPALPIDMAIEMIRAGRGTQFDPAVTDAFMASAERVGAEFLVGDAEGTPGGTAPLADRPPPAIRRRAGS